MLKYNDPFWWLTVVFKEAGFTEVERNPNDVALSIELSYYNNYYEDMILELLNTLVPFTAEGFISYRGEKGDLWCHVFAGGEWTERSGRICYDEPRPQFEESKQNLARLIEEIRRQVIYDDRPYLDCYAEGRIQPECEKKRWHLGTYKTLETSLSAMQTLGALGGALTYFASEYLWENGERFLSNRDLRIRALQKRQKEEEAEKS